MASQTSSGHAAAESTFSDAQWANFQAEDFAAGKAVVILMLGIFSIGVLLYATVAFTVWREPPWCFFQG